METNISDEHNPIEHSQIKGLVDFFFPAETSSSVKSKLLKWFVFALSEKGLAIQNLQTNEFIQFTDKLIQLVNTVHQRANVQAKLTQKGVVND